MGNADAKSGQVTTKPITLNPVGIGAVLVDPCART